MFALSKIDEIIRTMVMQNLSITGYMELLKSMGMEVKLHTPKPGNIGVVYIYRDEEACQNDEIIGLIVVQKVKDYSVYFPS